jgi:hypothetical protein
VASELITGHETFKSCFKKQLKTALGPEYVENISSCSLNKTSDQRKLRLLSVYFSIFECFTVISKKAILPLGNLAKLVFWSILGH